MSPTTYPELLRLARKRPIYLWGAGPTGAAALLRFRQDQLPVAGFLDSDRSKHGRTLAGVAIQAPARLQAEGGGARPFVVICSSGEREIAGVLRGLGFAAGADFLTGAEVPRRGLAAGERARLRRIIHDALFVERNPLVAAALVLGYRYFLKRAIWVRERIEAGEQTSDLPNPFLYRLR